MNDYLAESIVMSGSLEGCSGKSEKVSRFVKVSIALALLFHIFFVTTFLTGIPKTIFTEAALGLGRGSDFFGIYQGGVNLLNGHNIYDPDLPEIREHRDVPYFYYFRYLPPVAMLSAIMTLFLDPWPAYWTWVVINELLVLLVVLWILRWKQWSCGRRIFAAALWLGYFPLCIEQYMGQFSLSMAVFLLILWRYDTGRSRLSESNDPCIGDQPSERPKPLYSWKKDRMGHSAVPVAWSASIFLKSFSILMVIPYLRDRLFKRVIYSLGAVFLLSMPYFLLRPRAVIDFTRFNLSPFAILHKGDFGFQAFIRVIFRILVPDAPNYPVGITGSVNNPERILLVAVSALIIFLAVWASFRLRDLPDRRALDLMIWTTVFFLIYKTVWEYHYLMLLPALTAVILSRGTPLVYAMGIIIGLPSIFGVLSHLGVDPASELDQWPAWVKVVYFGGKPVPTLVLFVWAIITPGGNKNFQGKGSNF